MTPFELVPEGHPALTSPAAPFEFGGPLDPYDLADGLEALMREKGGLGLAAPQVGLSVRAFSLRTEPASTMFNPRVVDVSEETVELEEGCLSVPGLILRITRPRLIRLRFQLKDGEHHTSKFDGMTSRAVQHELDHLDGVMFTSRVSRLRLDMARRKAAKRR